MFNSLLRPSSNSITTTKRTSSLQHKKALCVGINDYPGTNNDLRGCVNDARMWAELLSSTYQYNIQTLFDKRATVKSFLDIIGNYINNSQSGDYIVITFSGHGTQVPDKSGDEENGLDEAFCLYDGLVIDDDIRYMLKSLNKEANLTVISDCCHSGTITRSFLSAMNQENIYHRPRYMPPTDANLTRSISIPDKIFKPESDMQEILLSGCLPHEYSYDAFMGGMFRGAMSYYAIETLKKTPNISYNKLHQEISKNLPSSRYPQTPQLEGNDENKNKNVFC
jgi:metacaspase-1